MQYLKMFLSKAFLINAAIAIALIAGMMWGVLQFLEYYTLHGETIAVPDFTGLQDEDITKIIEKKELRYEVVDSVFISDMPKGAAVAQDPQPNSLVKKNRTIYITMNSFHPPRVKMPRLIDRTMREVVIITENMGLKVGEIKPIPAICPGCVLRQYYDGEEIEEGSLIPKGAIIDLVVGMGISSDKIRVPLLIDLNLDSAENVLNQLVLNKGAVIYDSEVVWVTAEDSAKAKVYKQNPQYSEKTFITLGSSVDLFLTTDSTKIDTKIRENYVNDTTIRSTTANDTLISKP